MFDQTGHQPKHRHPIPAGDTSDTPPWDPDSRARCITPRGFYCWLGPCPRHDPIQYALWFGARHRKDRK